METKYSTKKMITMTEDQLVSMEFAAFKGGVSVGKKIVDAAVAEARRMQMEKSRPIERKPAPAPKKSA